MIKAYIDQVILRSNVEVLFPSSWDDCFFLYSYSPPPVVSTFVASPILTLFTIKRDIRSMAEQTYPSTTEMLHDATRMTHVQALSAFSTVRKTGVFQNYIQPVFVRVKELFNRAPLLFKIGLLGFCGLSAIPLGCFFGFMSIVTVGSFVLGGIAFSVVEVRTR